MHVRVHLTFQLFLPSGAACPRGVRANAQCAMAARVQGPCGKAGLSVERPDFLSGLSSPAFWKAGARRGAHLTRVARLRFGTPPLRRTPVTATRPPNLATWPRRRAHATSRTPDLSDGDEHLNETREGLSVFQKHPCLSTLLRAPSEKLAHALVVVGRACGYGCFAVACFKVLVGCGG